MVAQFSELVIFCDSGTDDSYLQGESRGSLMPGLTPPWPSLKKGRYS